MPNYKEEFEKRAQGTPSPDNTTGNTLADMKGESAKKPVSEVVPNLNVNKGIGNLDDLNVDTAEKNAVIEKPDAQQNDQPGHNVNGPTLFQKGPLAGPSALNKWENVPGFIGRSRPSFSGEE